MYFEKLSNEILLQNIYALVKKEREITLEILHLLQEIERRRLFAEIGFSSLFEYAVKVLHYSEGAAQRRISSMRLLRSLPELETKVESGALSLSVLAQAQTFFRQEKLEKNNDIKKEILLELEGKSSREVERELIARSTNPEKALLQAKESLRPLSPNYSQLSIVIDAQLLQELEELRGLLAARNPHMSLKEVIEFSIGHSLKHLRMKPPKEPRASTQKEPASAKASTTKKEPSPVKFKATQKNSTLDKSNAPNIKAQNASSPANTNSPSSARNCESNAASTRTSSTSIPPASAVNAPQTYTLTTNASSTSRPLVPESLQTSIPIIITSSLPPASAVNASQTSTLTTNASSSPPASAATSPSEFSPMSAANCSPEFSSPPAVDSPSEPPSPPQVPRTLNKPNSRYIPIQIKRQIWQRDQNQCTYVHADTSRRCTSTFNLQIDHIQPHAKGGANSLDNLRLLCRAHNTHVAIEEFGAQKMKSFLH